MADATEHAANEAAQTIRNTAERASEETRKMGLAAADAGNEILHMSARIFEQNADMVRSGWRLGFDMTTTLMNRSAEHVNRAMGLAGGNGTKEAAERSVRNAETIMHSTTAIAKGMNGMTRECMELARHQMEHGLDLVDRLWACRTPQEFAAAHSDVVREAIDDAVKTGRKVADMSMKVADETAGEFKQAAA